MPERRVPVFFYGLFMEEAALRAKGFDPRNSRAAAVPGMALRIGARAMLVADPRATAHGFVMELTHAEIDTLYAEPSVAMYRPEPVLTACADGATIAALCFNLPIPPGPDEANPDYAARLRALGRTLGLPAAYVESIR
jgi:hypothetical protein